MRDPKQCKRDSRMASANSSYDVATLEFQYVFTDYPPLPLQHLFFTER